MTKDEIISKIGRPIFKPLGFIQIIFLLTFISSFFIVIWFSFALATKVGLTGFLGLLIITPIYNMMKKPVAKAVEEQMDKIEKEGAKSKFQMRLEKLQKERTHGSN